MTPLEPHIATKQWSEVAATVKEVAPKPLHDLLARVATRLGQTRAKVCTVSAPFGERLLQNGRLPFWDRLPQHSKRASWPSLPLGLITRHAAEVFLEVPDAIEEGAWGFQSYPLAVLRPGEFFGVFEAVDRTLQHIAPQPRWCMTAGARTLHLVVALGDDRLQQTIRSTLDFDAPEQCRWERHSWQLMRAMARRADGWRTEAILFPDHWFSLAESGAPRELNALLFRLAWEQSAALRREAERAASIGAWFAQRVEHHRRRFTSYELEVATDWTTPYLLQLTESIVAGESIALKVLPLSGSIEDSDLGPFRQASVLFNQMAADSGAVRQPLLALPTGEAAVPRYVPLELPLRRGPVRHRRGWPFYMYLLGRVLKTVQGDLPNNIVGMQLDLNRIDLIALPPRGKRASRPNRKHSSVRIWGEQLGTRRGKLLPATPAELGEGCPELGNVGERVIADSPFFAACIRIDAMTKGKSKRGS